MQEKRDWIVEELSNAAVNGLGEALDSDDFDTKRGQVLEAIAARLGDDRRRRVSLDGQGDVGAPRSDQPAGHPGDGVSRVPRRAVDRRARVSTGELLELEFDVLITGIVAAISLEVDRKSKAGENLHGDIEKALS